MTTSEITRRVAEIRSLAGDDEAAHSAEDKLRDIFIHELAAMTGTAMMPWRVIRNQARLVLSTNAISFYRRVG